ncbi:hypothetical protein SJAV_09160 [Sulfurisphaera javensis]|uniref:Uncharacterized protein n=1 Tax=Sulfurisphaera javensis TaxID=2049879 RepID=A0AAT9GPZ5_9CREN
MTFVSLYILLREKTYNKIIFVSNDIDFKRIYTYVYDYTKDIISGKRDPRRYLVSDTEKVLETLNNLKITDLSSFSCNEL